MTQAEQAWIAVVGEVVTPAKTDKVDAIGREAEARGATWRPSTLPVVTDVRDVPATLPKEEGNRWVFQDDSAILLAHGLAWLT